MTNIDQVNSTSDTAASLWGVYEAIYDELEVLTNPALTTDSAVIASLADQAHCVLVALSYARPLSNSSAAALLRAAKILAENAAEYADPAEAAECGAAHGRCMKTAIAFVERQAA
ncbi:hypothetical protein [Brucella haematophila]|uniref:Uncharacterized protein n=1 Tax=Brucella haematophila TaxID=419474 RepID=A0ABX1DHE4_9HYPH|nr:hypothetical protein [Brucella haematophila]NKC02406.1 hypothetical protein [Brucella haematophila]TMV03135.1 hypothetical protein FGI60_12015 [Brucella haematophila]